MTTIIALISQLVLLAEKAFKIGSFCKNIFSKEKLSLEYANSFNKSWSVKQHNDKYLNKEIKELKNIFKNILKVKPTSKTSYVNHDFVVFQNIDEYVQFNNQCYSFFESHQSSKELKNRFSSVWLDFSTWGLHWKSKKHIELAFKDFQNTECFKIVPIPLESEDGSPYVDSPCEIEFRLRNIGRKTIHITSISAETVALFQLGAGSGCELLAAQTGKLELHISMTSQITKLNVSSIADPDDIVKLIITAIIPDGFGDGGSDFLVRFTCEYNKNQSLLLGYYWFTKS